MSNAVKECKPYVRIAEEADCAVLAAIMREEDREELFLMTPQSPEEVLRDSLSSSTHTFTVMRGDTLVAMFGVTNLPTGEGVPWMLASDELKSIRKTFLKECRGYVKMMLRGRSSLCNAVWIGNQVHIQWLRWLGFTFLPPVRAGRFKREFLPFYMKG